MHKIEKIIVTPEEDALLKQKEAELLVKQQGTPQDEGQEVAPVQSSQEQEKGFLESKFDSVRNLPDKFMNDNPVDFEKETRDFEREQKETKERIDKLLGE
jgi:hypothetical protein